MEVHEYQMTRLLPTLRKLGYDGPTRFTTFKGLPFAVKVECTDPNLGMTHQPHVLLYARDAYPVTGKGEAVLHFWSWVGNSSMRECQRIAAALTKDGVPARATTYRKNAVVAFEPGDWLNADKMEFEPEAA